MLDLDGCAHPEFARCRFTPHDFRRLFSTDIVNHGLPIHIGAALLGQLDIQTAQGYVTLFNEDVVRLDEIHEDLITRRGQAESEGWLGELEGVDLTLRFRQEKRIDTQRLARSPTTSLGMPTIRLS